MTDGGEAPPVLEVRSLTKEFRIRGKGQRRTIRPVDDVSFAVHAGRTTALVGESGSGKSTLSRLIMRLYKPDSGSILIKGVEIQDLGRRALRPLRPDFQMVFQNPLLSFDPSKTIGQSIAEVHRLSGEASARARREQIEQLLVDVGLSPSFAELRPRGVSGGELQRAALARAISVYPDLLVLDEPTSALDVSIQGQVLSLLHELQRERGLAYLFATHDLRVVRMTSDDVLVMYRGRIMERATTGEIFASPRHPYTRSLLSAELAGEVDVVEDAGDACPIGGDCAPGQHGAELSETHWVRCWRGYEGPGRR